MLSDYVIPGILFAILFITHLICIRIGWVMGCKADQSITTNEHIKPVKQYNSVDPYADEVI